MSVVNPSLIRDPLWPNRGPVYYPKPSATLELTWQSGESVHDDLIYFVGYKHFALEIPTAFDGAAIKVYGAVTEPTTFADMFEIRDGAAGLVDFLISTSTVMAPFPQGSNGLAAVKYIAFRTMDALGGAANVVTQTGERTVNVMFMG